MAGSGKITFWTTFLQHCPSETICCACLRLPQTSPTRTFLEVIPSMKHFIAGLAVSTLLAVSATASFAADDKVKDAERLASSSSVINEIMGIKDKSIPDTILAGASCVVVVPSYKKAAFGVGARSTARVLQPAGRLRAGVPPFSWS